MGAPVLHYVDDLSGVGGGDVATPGSSAPRSSTTSSTSSSTVLETAARSNPRTPGSHAGSEDQSARVLPRPDRRDKLSRFVEEALERNGLRTDEAEQLAGKMGFYQ